MNLKHLLQGYNFNKVNATLEEEFSDSKEKSGVIKFSQNIYGSYLLDKEGIVVALSLFANGITNKERTLKNQINHVINTLTIIQNTIELIGNTTKEEANKILESLGMFDKKIKTKAVRFTNYIYKVETLDGLLIFSVFEEVKDNARQS